MSSLYLSKTKHNKKYYEKVIKIYKKTSILNEAEQIQKFIENNKVIPKACKLDTGVRLSPYSLTYLISELILNPKRTDYSLKAVVKYNTQTHKDTINEKVTQKDYLKMINNFLEYCNTNKRVPSYITTSQTKTRVSFELFMYCLSKIVVYYANNNSLPNYCLFNAKDITNTASNNKTSKKTNSTSTSSNLYTQKGLNHTLGCNGLGQCTPYYCACNSLQQMFHKLSGKTISEKTIAQWAGTTTNGTSHQGINTAIHKYDPNLKVSWKNFSDLGNTTEARFKKLGELMSDNNTAVFTHLYYRNKYGHYEVPYQIDTKNKTIKVLNSLGDRSGNGYPGYIETRTYNLEADYIRNTPGGQPSICIIRK